MHLRLQLKRYHEFFWLRDIQAVNIYECCAKCFIGGRDSRVYYGTLHQSQKYMGLTDELFREKLIDEAGDVMWYVAEVCTGFNYDIEDLNVVLTPKDYEVGIYEDNESCALRLIEQTTRCAVSRKSITHFVYLREVVSHLAILLVKAGIDIQEVLQHNIDKLRVRYPDGFSANRSNGRYQH